VCRLDSKKSQTYTIKVLYEAVPLSSEEYDGYCYMVSSSEEYQTVTFLIAEVNKNMIDMPLAVGVLDAEDWSSNWFGKHSLP
jgi:hypothetical protein